MSKKSNKSNINSNYGNKYLDIIIDLKKKNLELEKKCYQWYVLNQVKQQRIDNAEKYIYDLKKKWLASSIKNNTSLYEFEAYIGGMSKLIKINNILEGEDKKND